MKGLELSERFFREEVAKLIDKYFPEITGKYAGGLNSYGSDVLGYDDELSRDHEWGPRCIIWLSDTDYDRFAHQLDQVLNQHLPKQFMGVSTRYKVDNDLGCLVMANADENGFHHVAITTVSRQLRIQYGLESEIPSYVEWLCIPEQKLLELTRGKVFTDPIGDITRVRRLFSYFPDDIWRFKLMYAWESLKNLDIIPLCTSRGDILSAKLAIQQVASQLIRLTFLHNRCDTPGTLKWLSREFYLLPRLATGIGPLLEECLVSTELNRSAALLQDIIGIFMDEHNRLHITDHVNLDFSQYARGFKILSCTNVINALNQTLPPELKTIEVHGAIDQWITNDDILLFSEQFTKFDYIYKTTSGFHRDGIGDRMI
ncbi:MAG: hypothetical protein JWN30_2133 [Bacilli bacterium]|nr:hypothetical protein [Bacilli bacterium]